MEDTNVVLALLATELGETVERVAHELGPDDVFPDAGGFRCCTEARAAELISRRERRQEEAAERHARRAAEARREAAARRADAIARGRELRESAARGESRVRRMKVTGLTEVRGLDDLPSATGAMLAGAPPEYEGGAMTPRPSRLDWILGQAEGGGTFGPRPRPRENKGRPK